MEFEISVTHLAIHGVSVFLNGAIFWTIVRKPLSKCPSNRFVLSLSTSHILVSLLTLLISLSWFIDTSVTVHMEQVNFYVTFGAGLVNSLTLTTIACERYVTIARPMRYKSIVTTYRCSLIVIFLWALSTCITLIPLIVTDLNPDSSAAASAASSPGAPFFAIVFTTITLLCLSVMSICYYIIFTIAKEKCQHVQIGQFTASISSDWPSSAYPSQAEGQKPSSLLHHVLKANTRNAHCSPNTFRSRLQQVEQIKQQQRRSKPMQNSPRKTIATIIALVGSLVITQLPISSTLYDDRLWNVSLIMLSLSSITNPILYGFLNRKIRVQLWKTFRIQSKPKRPDCCFHRQHSVYSDIIKDIVQGSQIITVTVPPVLPPDAKLPPSGIFYGDKNTSDKNENGRTIIGRDEQDNHELTQLPDATLQFPRKDSQDSGADMTFSDEEEEQTPSPSTKEPSVFTICSKRTRDDA